MSDITADVARHIFPQTPPAVLDANLPAVLSALQLVQLTTLPLVMVALATIATECGGLVPANEKPSTVNTTRPDRPFDKYDRMRGNRPGDGLLFHGRGYVQLTGRANYTTLGPIVGQPDLVDNPALALEPDIAASVLAAFLRARLPAIDSALAAGRLDLVRKCVNGGDNGFPQFEKAYLAGTAAYNRAVPAPA